MIRGEAVPTSTGTMKRQRAAPILASKRGMQAGDGGRRAAGAARTASGAAARAMPLSTSLSERRRASRPIARFSLRAGTPSRPPRARTQQFTTLRRAVRSSGTDTDRRLDREMLLRTLRRRSACSRSLVHSLARSRARVRVRRVYFVPPILDARLTRASRSFPGISHGIANRFARVHRRRGNQRPTTQLDLTLARSQRVRPRITRVQGPLRAADGGRAAGRASRRAAVLTRVTE